MTLTLSTMDTVGTLVAKLSILRNSGVAHRPPRHSPSVSGSNGGQERVGIVMADAGGFLPKRGEMGSPDRARLLRQIAAALNLPVAALVDEATAQAERGPSAEEVATLLDAFSRIEDSRLRAHCLEVVKGCASR